MMPHELTPTKKREFLDAFNEFLDGKGLRNTAERQAIVKVMLDTADHLEVEDILFRLRGLGKRVSRATIYRTISLLVEAGLVKSVSFEQRHAHYELILHDHDHDHIACMQCNQVIEQDSAIADRLVKSVCEQYGFEPVRRHFEIIVACPTCDTEDEEKQKEIDLAVHISQRQLPKDQDEFIAMFQEYLKLRGLRYTKEREAIISILFEATAEDHLDVEEIQRKLATNNQKVSRATVYRSMGLFVESGLVKQVSFEHRHAHYEALVEGADHDHLICVSCDKVIEFSHPLSKTLLTNLSEKHGFIPVRRHFEIFGVCSDYVAKDDAESGASPCVAASAVGA